jgi:starch synthase
LKVLFAASESVPFCKTGGLGDVVGALLVELERKKHDARLILPKYRDVDAARFGFKPLSFRLPLPLGDTLETVRVWEGRLAKTVPVYLIDAPKYFDREGLYREPGGEDFPDNDERFVLFARAVLETAKAVDFRPDVVHCHDWQTGLIPAYLATVYRLDGFFLPTATAFTVHNIAYQGQFPKNTLFLAGFSWADFTPDRLEYYDQMNFLKAGLVFSDALNTVSPSYAVEVQSDAEFGRGMEGLLRSRAADFFGILNGIDRRDWDPARDPHIAKKYAAKRLDPRAACKKDLQKAAGLAERPGAPLFGMVSRLDPQKGFDLMLSCVEQFLEDGAQLVVLGQGDKEHEAALRALAGRYPGTVAFHSDFNEPLAHKIYAGCDIFVMPSRFEPCGLGQMIALRYGAVPVVTPTGGLRDTVPDAEAADGKGMGFVAEDVSAAGLQRALARAVAAHRAGGAAWKGLQSRGMAAPYGWDRSVEEYVKLYKHALARKAERNA